MSVLRVAGVQMRNVVGDIDGNAARVAEAMRWAQDEGADVLVLPELALTGYPVGDLVLHGEFVTEAQEAIEWLAASSGATVSIVGTVWPVPPRRSWDSLDRSVSISAAVLSSGENRGLYHKVLLPTHGAFDEGKNIAPGGAPSALWRIGDVIAGICICEDLWSGDGPPEQQSAGGAQVIFAPNASPYHRTKPQGRLELVRTVARRNGVPLVYLNLVGGQDELVFDGGSLVAGGDGKVLHRAAHLAEDRFCLDLPIAPPRAVTGPVSTVHTRPVAGRPATVTSADSREPEQLAYVWDGLRTGVRDFVDKNAYEGAVVGLSGGIDAAVTAALAADALGPERVLGVAIPSAGSSPQDEKDAAGLAANLGIEYAVVPVTEMAAATVDAVGQSPPSPAITARLRALLLSAMADQRQRLLLATGNKTELSIGGVAWLGDMTGGFAPLKDCPKTLLYDLARHRNLTGTAIPAPILEKETSAQRADASLPSYDVLDTIVERYVEYGHGIEDFVADGLDADLVLDVLRRVDGAEHKRRLTPPGIKITPRAFGTDRRMPISNGWRAHRRGDSLPPGFGRQGAAVEPETPSTEHRPPAR